jgi:putative ABC transport system permease protein
VPGVAKATGVVLTDGAAITDKYNKLVPNTGGPRFGAAWTGTNPLVEIRSGRTPSADDEIMISANLAKTTGYAIGDKVGVGTAIAPRIQQYTLVGIVGYTGGRDSLAGETLIYFNEPVAQKLMLGETGVYSSIRVSVDQGTPIPEVQQRIASTLGSAYTVKTGQQLAAETADSIKQGLKFFTYLLLGFAGIALFVGTFLILNTFSIIVAQRTRELALFRAMGAGRGQVIGSVLTEAVVIGLISSVVGLAVGIGIGALLGSVLGRALSGGALELAGIGVPPAAVIAAFAVGLGVTVIAALLPAVRAARVPPVAAMRDVAIPDRPLTAITVAGAIVLAIGGTVLGLGLTGKLGGGNLSGVLGGLLTCFVGVALLTPVVARPVVALLGKLLSWNAAGALGRRNSARNPRRTAITAAALMVSIALVTGISVIFDSVKASTVAVVNQGLDADLVVSSDPLSGGALGGIDPSTMDAIRSTSGVKSAVGLLVAPGKIDGKSEVLVATDDVAAAVTMFGLKSTAGTLAPLPAGSVLVDDKTAKDRGLSLGSTMQLQMARGSAKNVTVAGLYEKSSLVEGIVVSGEDAKVGFVSAAPIRAYVKVAPGSNVASVEDSMKAAIQDNPQVNVSTVDDFIARTAQIFNFILVFVQLLLGLAMVIAVLGIINTLALSMTERTRELGLLRAVGMQRGQMMWMVTVESVVISVFGALLGIVVGAGLGVAVFQAFRDQGFTKLAFPWPLMVAYVIASVFVGLVAGLIPAIRASRLNVLGAIAYE